MKKVGMAETCKLNTQGVQAGGSVKLHSKSEGSLGCIRPGFKKIKKKEAQHARCCLDFPDGTQLPLLGLRFVYEMR